MNPDLNHFFYNNIFDNKKILILAPHEDDEINIMGDLISTFISRNCNIYLVFSTNGDFFLNVNANKRIHEAHCSASSFGVQKENIFFLGYGDRLVSNNCHLYNSPATDTITSNISKTHTYGGIDFIDYHYKKYGEHANYSKDMFFNDLYDIVKDIKADIIFSVDYDTHPDHIALSSTFEEVIHTLIVKENYRPIIFKSFAYDTCFYAKRDYCSVNHIETLQPILDYNDSNATNDSMFPCYRWSERLRLPVQVKTLTNNIFNSYQYKALKCHKSQLDARHFAGRIINSDKVFWERRTDSILYTSNVTVSSGDGSYLTDFKIVDSDNILNFEKKQSRIHFNNCAWIPDSNDNNTTCTFILKQPSSVSQIVLYENPSPNSTINTVELSLDNGYKQIFNIDYHDGSSNCLSFPKQDMINSITLKIIDYSGDDAGISELEAYVSSTNSALSSTLIFKIICNNNFVYNYYESPNSTYTYDIYTYPFKKLSKDDLSITINTTNNRHAQIKFITDTSFVVEGDFRKCTINIALNNDPNLFDTITITRIGLIKANLIKLLKHSESFLFFKYRIISKINRILDKL